MTAAAPAGAHIQRMQTNLLDKLRTIGNRVTTAWPDIAVELAALERAKDLTLRDLAVLFLLAPGEHVGRAAVEALVGEGAADIVIGSLDGHGLVVEAPDGIRLTERGRDFIAQLVEMRAQAAARVLGTLPDATRDAILDGLDAASQALPRSEALERLEPA